MALDEPKEDDAVYELDGFKYIIRKTLMDQVKPVKVDFTSMGFRITSNMSRGAGCSTCA
jgi:Fe-S cluster assembly iron-binding protein IscA